MIPGLVAAIDEARADPDQLYLSLSNQERDRKIWPIGGDVVEINGGQIVRPNLRVPFNEVVDINFLGVGWRQRRRLLGPTDC